LSPLSAKNAGHTGLNRITQAVFSTSTWYAFAGQVISRRTLPQNCWALGGQATGPGLGGHCVPIDPFYLTWKARQYEFPTRFIELAGEINTAMPRYVVERLSDGLNLNGKPLKHSEILLLGVAYKRDIEDTRESPALTIIRLLEARLARVSYHDPHVPVLRSRHLDREMSSVELTPETVASSDAVVIVTDHRNVDYPMLLKHAKLVVDTRNVTAPYRRDGSNVILA